MAEGKSIEWDIDANLPLYTRDFFKAFKAPSDNHVCSCHLGLEQCYGCEAINCDFVFVSIKPVAPNRKD